MAKEYVTPSRGLKIRWVGLFDLSTLYRSMKNWLADEGLFNSEEDLEKQYTEKITQTGKIIEARWEIKKKLSNYFTYRLMVEFRILGLVDMEIPKEDYKIKLQKADIAIFLTAYVETGGEEWEKLGPLNRFYQKIIARKRLDGYKIYLYNKIYKFQNFIKDSLEMARY